MAKQKKKIIRRPPLTDREKELMLVVLVRNQEAFEAARPQLTYEHFNEYETYLSVVWQVVCEHFDEHNELPAGEHVTTAINARMREDEMLMVAKEEVEALDHFLAWAFWMEESALRVNVAMSYLRRFLQEKLARKVQGVFSEGYMPESMFSLMQTFTEQASKLEVLDSAGLDEPFAEGWDDPEEVPEKVTTGLDFLDTFMGGGAAIGETHGVLGPYMGGKTTIFVQLSVALAEHFYTQWEASEQRGVRKVVYYFTWEEPPFSLRLRALSSSGRISRDNLEKALEAHDYTLLSTTGALEEYERRLFADKLEQGEPTPGEIERFSAAKETLNQTWRIVDMTGNDPKHPGRGIGLVDEVVAVIQQDQATLKRRGENCGVAGVFVDYVGAAVERHIDANDINRDQLRHFINQWPFHMGQKVGVKFKCPVWSAHQLSPQANTKRPGETPKHTDSSEGRAFGQNVDFCFVLGNSTQDNILLCACTKHRRREKPKGPAILKLEGILSRMVDQSGKYVRKGGDIVRRDEARQVTDGSARGSDQPTDIPGGDDQERVASQQAAIRGNTYSPGATA